MSDTNSNPRRPIFLGKEEYLAQQLTDRDISELDEWIRSRFIEMARKSLASDASEEERERTLRVAMREAQSMTWVSGQGARIIGTIDGLARLMWQMIHHNHPGVTPEQIRRHLADPETMRENMARINDTFEQLNVGEGKSFSRGERKVETQKRKKSRPVRPSRHSR